MIAAPAFATPFSALRPAALRLAALSLLVGTALLSGCAGRVQAPMYDAPIGLSAARIAAKVDALPPTDVLMLGEQHDAPEHQQLAQHVLAHLAGSSRLAAVVIEMSDAGPSTAALQPHATPEQVRRALQWNDKAWPWDRYEAPIMTAVRAGVPVMGGNLPRALMVSRMADRELDGHLPAPALEALQASIVEGHCGLLPASQVAGLTRVQIAKDITMAHVISQAAFPGKVTVLLSGSTHANRRLGVPHHLPTGVTAYAVRLQAGPAANDGLSTAAVAGDFDAVWLTAAVPYTDYCATLRKQWAPAIKP